MMKGGYEFLNVIPVNWSTGCCMMSSHSTTDHKKFKWRSLLLTGPGGSTWHTLRGHTGRSMQSADVERQDLGHMLLLGSMGGVLGGTWAEARLVSSNPESRILVSPMGV